MKKLTAMLLAILTTLTLFTACSEKEPVGEGKKIIKINGKIMNNKVYEYYLSVEELNNPDSTFEEKETAAVKSTARHLYISELCTEKGIEINSEGKKTIDGQISSLIEQYGSEEDFLKEISQYSLDYDAYYALTESEYLENILKTEMIKTYSDQQRLEFYNNEMVNVQHILFTTVDQNQIPLEDAVAADKKALAVEVLAKVKDGTDFKEMVALYNEDPGLTNQGYMLSKYSLFVKPFLNAALALDVGETTDLVETSYGYHIIKRYEHQGNTELYEASVNDINDGLFEQQFDEWYDKADIVVK